MTGDAIELERVERWKNISRYFSDCHGFPRANNEISEEHHPASEIADDGRKNLRGVGGFSGGVGKPLDPLSIDIPNRNQNDSANGKSESSPGWTAAAQPIVHEDEPARADHCSEGQRKIIVETKFAG